MRHMGSIFLIVTGFLACPCHLLVTLPLVAGLLAGTALGSFLIHHTGLVTTFASIYFGGTLLLGGWMLVQPKRRHQTPAVRASCVGTEAVLEKGRNDDFAQTV